MPNKTIYIKDSDLPLWERAQNELGESVSSTFVEFLKERLERHGKRPKGRKMDMVQAMDAFLAELNAELDLNIERHPFWSAIILDASSDKVGYKLHQRHANPDRIMSLVVHPMDFGPDGRLESKVRSRIISEGSKFWDGKNNLHHTFVDVTTVPSAPEPA